VDATGCDPSRLRQPAALEALFARIVRDLDLRMVGVPLWHAFPGPGGVTGLCLLAESHLAVHTFPEHGSLCLNLFCCRPRPEWEFDAGLRAHVGAGDVSVRRVTRRHAALDIPPLPPLLPPLAASRPV
jgi:S-adenosylmethionine decarboxylase